MATLEIKVPEAAPGEGGMEITIDGPTPPPAFIEFEDADGEFRRYIPLDIYQSERALNAELVKALKAQRDAEAILTRGERDQAIVRANAMADAALAKAEAREKGD